jgi:hypothetical protein
MFIINIVIEIIKLFFDLCTLIAGEDAYLFMVFFAIPFWILIFFAVIKIFQWLTSFSNVLINVMRYKHRKKGSQKRKGIIEHRQRNVNKYFHL